MASSDARDLGEFARTDAAEAFERLSRRYAGMVFAACLRRLGSREDAEDASQAVFAALAMKARSVRPDRLTSWLHGTAMRTSAFIARTRARRARHEEEAARMRPTAAREVSSPDIEAEAVKPRLDGEIARLPVKLREAVMRHYLAGQSHAELARDLRVPEGTAASRVSAGLDRLRQRLAGRGATLGAAGLAALLAGESQTAAPASLLASLPLLVTAASATGAGAGAGAAVTVAKGAFKMMFWAKVKVVAAVAGGVVLAGGGGGLAVRLAAGEPRKKEKPRVERKLNPRIAAMKDNTWLYMNPKPMKRKRPTTKDTNSPLKGIVSGEPTFREYSSPVYGGGRIYYFGGMHSGYPGNDIEVYDIVENFWKQSSYRLQCPPQGDPAYGSGGSENCWVDPETGAGQPYSIHGYSRTSYHPLLKRYACTATFPRKVRKDPKSGRWELAEKVYGLISYDHRTDKWELLAEGKGGDLTQWDSALGGFLAVRRNTIWLFKDGKWKRHDTTKVGLARSGGSASIYLPDRKSHLFALMPHGGAKGWGKLYIYNSVEKQLTEIASVPAELKKRFVPLGNFVMAYDLANRKAVCMSGDPDKVLTWSYDPAADRWEKLPQASKSPPLRRGTFGPGSGREPLVYDPLHGVFLLVAHTDKGVQTWAYRYKRAKKK